MSQISALIAWKNKNYDYQLSALARFIMNAGVSGTSGLEVTTWSVASWEAFILCTRTNGQQIMVHYQNTAAVTIDTTGTKKIWVGISQSVVDDGSSNAVDGTNIATIQVGDTYPSANYLPLASITDGVITDERSLISLKNILRKGFGSNKHVRINRTSWLEEVNNVTDGSTLLSTDKIRVEKAGGDFEDFEFGAFQSALSPQALSYQSQYYPIEDLLANDAIFEYNHPTISQTINGYFNVGDVTWNQIVTLAKRISSWVSGNSITIKTDKASASANFGIRIVTCDSSGVPTTTLVDPNAVQYVAAGSVSSGWATTTITFPASFTCWDAGSLVAIQVCQWTFASPTVNSGAYYKVGMAVWITDLATEINAISNAGWSLIWGGAHSLSTTFTAARRCQITKIEFGYQAAIGMNISISSGGRTWTKTLTVAATLITLDAPFSVESGKTITVTWSWASWSNWNASSWSGTSSSDVTAPWLSQWPGFCRLYSLYALDLPCTFPMTDNGYCKKSRALDIITSYFSGICSTNTNKGAKPSIVNGFVPSFSSLSRIPYFLSSVAGAVSGTSDIWVAWFWVSPTILDTDQNVPFRNSWAVRSLDGDIYFSGWALRYLLATAAWSSATLKWTGDLANPSWMTVETLGASSSVDKVIHLPKGFLQLTYTGTVSTNQFHF